MAKNPENPCGSTQHDEHLCYLVSQGFHIEEQQEYEALVDSPAYCCAKCGRVANSPCNLCKAVKMEICD